jgi:hypothetical protein
MSRARKAAMVNGPASRIRQKAQPVGITTTAVQGFKSLADECRIEVRPFTLLAGANSRGKPSVPIRENVE